MHTSYYRIGHIRVIISEVGFANDYLSQPAPVNADYSFNEDNQYSPAKTLTCNNVILAVPPYTARQFTVAKEMMPALCYAVHERRLGHSYVQMKKDTPN